MVSGVGPTQVIRKEKIVKSWLSAISNQATLNAFPTPCSLLPACRPQSSHDLKLSLYPGLRFRVSFWPPAKCSKFDVGRSMFFSSRNHERTKPRKTALNISCFRDSYFWPTTDHGRPSHLHTFVPSAGSRHPKPDTGVLRPLASVSWPQASGSLTAG